MELNIKGPSYYAQNYELDKEIIKLFDELILMAKNKDYGPGLLIFDFCPVIAPNNLLQEGLWANSTSYSRLVFRGTVFHQIDFESYMNGTVSTKVALIKNSIICSSKLLKRKVGKDFDCKTFCKDVSEIVEGGV